MDYTGSIRKCYKVDNNCAYKHDVYQKTGKDSDKNQLMNFVKLYNFVPTYDKWCLYCDNRDSHKRCSKCRSVYFCSIECQKKAWPVHKLHCGRNLFVLCATCGQELHGSYLIKDSLSCDTCPVKFCSEECKTNLYSSHKEIDCDYFSKIFGENE